MRASAIAAGFAVAIFCVPEIEARSFGTFPGTFEAIADNPCFVPFNGYTVGGQYRDANNGVLLGAHSMLVRWQGDDIVSNPVTYDLGQLTGSHVYNLSGYANQRGYQPQSALGATPGVSMHCTEFGMLVNTTFVRHRPIVGGGYNNMYGVAWSSPRPRPFGIGTAQSHLVVQGRLGVKTYYPRKATPGSVLGDLDIGSGVNPASMAETSAVVSFFAYVRDTTASPPLPPIAVLLEAFTNNWDGDVTPEGAAFFDYSSQDTAVAASQYPAWIAGSGEGVWAGGGPISTSPANNNRLVSTYVTEGEKTELHAPFALGTDPPIPFFRGHVRPVDLQCLIRKIKAHPCTQPRGCPGNASRLSYSENPADYELEYAGVIAEAAIRADEINYNSPPKAFDSPTTTNPETIPGRPQIVLGAMGKDLGIYRGIPSVSEWRRDLLVSHADGRVALWLTTGVQVGCSNDLMEAGTGWYVAQIGDFNGDGKSDYVWQHNDGRMTIKLMNGLTVLTSTQLMNAGSGWSVTHTPDLNGDGKSDLVFRHTDGSIAVWTMNGTTITAGQPIIGPGGWNVAGAADFDGDGKGDLLFRHTDGRHWIYLMNGINIISSGQILGVGGWTATHTLDLNGDGKADISWQHTDGRIALYLMSGLTVVSGTDLIGAGSGWTVTRVGDFDGDGKTDLLFEHTDGRSYIYLMNGLTPTTITSLRPAGGWSAKRLQDMNGDGKADIVWQHTDGRTELWIMNGTSAASQGVINSAGTGWAVSAVSQP